MAITFKDRVSENPNRRKLTVVSSTNGEIQIADEIVVDVERNEGTITEQGTLFSASNMNTLMAADTVIRNQNEFDALVGQFNATIGSSDPAVIAACPKTIVLVGGGGNSPNGEYLVGTDGINLPWVKTGYFHLQGINGATLHWDCTGIEGERAAINGGVDNWADTNCTFKIENIRLEVVGSTPQTVHCFKECANISNCFVGISGTLSPGFLAFSDCSHIENCYGVSSSDGVLFFESVYISNCIGISTAASGYNAAFDHCQKVMNCKGTASYGLGFTDCKYVTNCEGEGMGAYGNFVAVGFKDCSRLTNCVGTGISTSINTGYGFKGCDHLVNCLGAGISHSTGQGYGFDTCERASNCRDVGSKTNMWNGTNKAIDPVTCKKTPATADNSALNS